MSEAHAAGLVGDDSVGRAELVRLKTLGLLAVDGWLVPDDLLEMAAAAYGDWRQGVTGPPGASAELEEEARRTGVWFTVRREQRQAVVEAYAVLGVAPPVDFRNGT